MINTVAFFQEKKNQNNTVRIKHFFIDQMYTSFLSVLDLFSSIFSHFVSDFLVL